MLFFYIFNGKICHPVFIFCNFFAILNSRTADGGAGDIRANKKYVLLQPGSGSKKWKIT
jgi:hypothetical protein